MNINIYKTALSMPQAEHLLENDLVSPFLIDLKLTASKCVILHKSMTENIYS